MNLMADYYNAFKISPVPAPAPDATAPEVYRGIYGMPMFVTVPTSDLGASVDFWTRGLGFIELFTIPDRISHLRRWAFQDALLVPADLSNRTVHANRQLRLRAKPGRRDRAGVRRTAARLHHGAAHYPVEHGRPGSHHPGRRPRHHDRSPPAGPGQCRGAISRSRRHHSPEGMMRTHVRLAGVTGSAINDAASPDGLTVGAAAAHAGVTALAPCTIGRRSGWFGRPGERPAVTGSTQRRRHAHPPGTDLPRARDASGVHRRTSRRPDARDGRIPAPAARSATRARLPPAADGSRGRPHDRSRGSRNPALRPGTSRDLRARLAAILGHRGPRPVGAHASVGAVRRARRGQDCAGLAADRRRHQSARSRPGGGQARRR